MLFTPFFYIPAITLGVSHGVLFSEQDFLFQNKKSASKFSLNKKITSG